jgi:hypothetical protein
MDCGTTFDSLATFDATTTIRAVKNVKNRRSSSLFRNGNQNCATAPFTRDLDRGAGKFFLLSDFVIAQQELHSRIDHSSRSREDDNR